MPDSKPAEPEPYHQQLQRAIVRIEKQKDDGSFEMQGTGVLVQPDYTATSASTGPIFIVTAAHVLAGYKAGRQMFVNFHDGAREPLDQTGTALLNLPDAYRDISIIAGPQMKSVKKAVLVGREQFMTWDDLHVGDPTVAPAFLGALTYLDGSIGPVIFRAGTIAAKTTKAVDLPGLTAAPPGNLLFVDAPTFGGNSGGPVFINTSLPAYSNAARGKSPRIFMGIMVRFVGDPAREFQVEIETESETESKKTKTMYWDNTGIAVVIPASTVAEAVDGFASAIAPHVRSENPPAVPPSPEHPQPEPP